MNQAVPPAAMTEGPVARQLLRMTIPMIWGLFATMGAQVAITWYIGRLGVPALAAASFTFPVMSTPERRKVGSWRALRW